ncbi:MAG TPA: GNAT family N-acetyltransferase [Mucilaginibacter sp.]|jgi:RimJ/RimL family protein N-acetyltransferase
MNDKPEYFIETPRLILRQWKKEDHDPFIALNRDADVMEFFPNLSTATETLAQIERANNHIIEYGYGFFAVERKDNHQFIGFTGLSHPRFETHFTPCVEIGWRLSKANWGQGFATEAAQASLDYGFNTMGLDEIYSFTSVLNKRSEQVMIKIGMIKEGFFDHPLVEDGHVLKEHVLYKINP